jgi:hypothetical protein
MRLDVDVNGSRTFLMSTSERLATETQIGEVEPNQFLEELKDISTRGLDPRNVGTLIESIYDKVDWDLSCSKHLLETL